MSEICLAAQMERFARLHTKPPPVSSWNPASQGPQEGQEQEQLLKQGNAEQLARGLLTSAPGFVYCESVKAGVEPRGVDELEIRV